MTERKTINMAPTWRAVLPLLVEVAVNGKTHEGRAEAMAELYRLAETVDKLNEENSRVEG